MPRKHHQKNSHKFYENIKPQITEKSYADGNGLYMLVKPNGSKLWHFRYTFNKKQDRITIKGAFPTVSLEDARLKAREYGKMLEDGINPKKHIRHTIIENQAKSEQIKLENEKATFTLEIAAREWLSSHAKYTTENRRHAARKLERFIFPRIGNRPLRDIRILELKKTLDSINYRESDMHLPEKERKPIGETMRRICGILNKIFTFYTEMEVIDKNPCENLLKHFPKQSPNNFKALKKPSDIGELLLRISEYKGLPETRCALELSLHLFVRPGNLQNAEWKHFDFESHEWTIPRSHMKCKRTKGDFIVPLSPQVEEILKFLRPLTEHRSKYLFPSIKSDDKPMSDGTLLVALRRMHYSTEQITVHGARASARTIGREILKINSEVLEMQLDHQEKGSYNGAYNRTVLLSERREAMNMYSAFLVEQREKAKAKRQSLIKGLSDAGIHCANL